MVRHESYAAPATVSVLAGGASSRFGGDKLAADLGGRSILEVTVGGLPGEWPVVCVGAERPMQRRVTWTLENPAGGGPLAAIAAALEQVGTDLVVVVAGDIPGAGRVVGQLLRALTRAAPHVGAVVATDGEGVANPLLAAYRVGALSAALPTDPSGRPARLLLRELVHEHVALDPRATLDVDTTDDLARLRDAEGS